MANSSKLNFHEKVTKKIKQHKKRTFKHTLLGLFACFIIVLGNGIFNTTTISDAKGDKDNNNDDEQLTMAFAGDIMMGRNIKQVTQEKGYDYPFQRVHHFFRDADFSTANFENPAVLNEGYTKLDKDINLKTDERAVKEIANQGIDTINLANNHTMDFGAEGLKDTMNSFKKYDVSTVGSGRNLAKSKEIDYKEVNGYKIAVLGFTDRYVKGFRAKSKEPGVLVADPKYYIPLVQEANENADIVVVHMHWGQEYDALPQTRQKEIGHALIDAGTDIVVGAHPHVLQPIDFYKKGVIFNSLGNFVFDQGWSQTSETALTQYTLSSNGDAKVNVYPMQITEGQPRLVEGTLGAYRKYKIYSQITKDFVYSQAWDNTWEVEGDHISHTIKNAVNN